MVALKLLFKLLFYNRNNMRPVKMWQLKKIGWEGYAPPNYTFFSIITPSRICIVQVFGCRDDIEKTHGVTTVFV
jgi:hypothetical protein